MAVILAAGITADKANWAQLLQALRTLARGNNMAVYSLTSGQQISLNGAAFTSTGATAFTPPYSGVAKVRLIAGGGGSGSAVSGGASGGCRLIVKGDAPKFAPPVPS